MSRRARDAAVPSIIRFALDPATGHARTINVVASLPPDAVQLYMAAVLCSSRHMQRLLANMNIIYECTFPPRLGSFDAQIAANVCFLRDEAAWEPEIRIAYPHWRLYPFGTRKPLAGRFSIPIDTEHLPIGFSTALLRFLAHATSVTETPGTSFVAVGGGPGTEFGIACVPLWRSALAMRYLLTLAEHGVRLNAYTQQPDAEARCAEACASAARHTRRHFRGVDGPVHFNQMYADYATAHAAHRLWKRRKQRDDGAG